MNSERPCNTGEAPGGIPEGAVESSLRYSVWDASLYASMAGFGELYFIPLLVAINASNFHIGIFSAIPQIFIALAQLASLVFIDRFMLRKPIIVAGASMQAIFIGAISIAVITRNTEPWIYIGFACGYFASIGFTGPAWNSLIGDLTDSATRGSFFGRRGGLSQLVLFLSSITAGFILQHFDGLQKPFIGFAIIFIVAFLSRTASVYTLTKHYEMPYKRVEGAYFSIVQFLKKTPQSNYAHFVFFVALMSFSVQVSAPYFATYMLRDLGFSYTEFTIAQGCFIATQFLAMRKWGTLTDSYGNRIVLRITATIMPIIPILWLFSRTYPYILALQILAGFAWAGWMLSTANFIFDAVTPPKRARCVAYLTLFNCLGIFLGALTGAYVSRIAPQSLQSGAITVVFFSSLQFIFLLSGLLRFVVLFLFMPTIREVRDVEEPRLKDIFLRFTNIRALNGVKFEVFPGSAGDDDTDECIDGPIE